MRQSSRPIGRATSLAAFAVPLAVYVASLPHGVGFWDTAEMQTVPYIFGIAHPTGFPSFVVLGYAFSHVFAFGSVAWRLSLMSAIAMAGAAWFIFRTLWDEGVHPVLACLAAWVLAFGYVAWTRGTRAEVHALALLFIAAAIWSALRLRARGATAALYLCAASVGLAAATHPVVLWILPGLCLLVVPVVTLSPSKGNADRAVLATFSATNLIVAACLVLAPLLLYLYMPVRSAVVTAGQLDPTSALGLPRGQAFWDWGHPANLHSFMLTLTGARFPKSDALLAILRPSAYPTLAKIFAAKSLAELGVVPLVLAVVGIVSVALKDRIKALALVLIALVGVPFAISYAIESDIDRYLLSAYWALAALAGIGAQALVSLLAPRIGSRVAIAAVAVVVLGSVAYTVNQNHDVFAQRADYSGEAFIKRVVGETPNNSVIVASWVYAAPLAYAAYVEQRFGQRIVVSAEANEIGGRLITWAAMRPVFVIYFTPLGQSAAPIRGGRLVPLGGEVPTIYRLSQLRH